MTDADKSNKEVSHTAIPSTDHLGLGRTSGQRGAEILAGFRAEKLPSPETLALSRWSGRIVARMLLQLVRSDAQMNYAIARAIVIEGLVRRALPADLTGVTVVEIASGMSPRGLRMARAIPEAKIIEVDLPGVVQDKKTRLAKAKDVTIPPNLEWREADLGNTPLQDVLEGKEVEAVSAEGLLGYFTHADITRISRNVKDSLKPGGVFVTDMGWTEGMEAIRQITTFFSRQAGIYKGLVKNAEQAREILMAAGYESVDMHLASEFIEDFKLPQPLVDISLFAVCHKAKEPTSETGSAPTPKTDPAT
jgi:O-methyltransferase involved in polyketide biosynthesis